MNFEDELERSRARKSRRREGTENNRSSRMAFEEKWDTHAEPGSRASSNRNASSNPHNRRRRNSNRKKKLVIGIMAAVLGLLVLLVGGAYAYLNHHM